jgi:hypothetical protein
MRTITVTANPEMMMPSIQFINPYLFAKDAD